MCAVVDRHGFEVKKKMVWLVAVAGGWRGEVLGVGGLAGLWLLVVGRWAGSFELSVMEVGVEDTERYRYIVCAIQSNLAR